MKRILLDTNVVIDVLLDRQPHAGLSTRVWTAIEMGAARGFVAAHAVTTVYYLLRRQIGPSEARRIIAVVLSAFSVAAVDEQIIHKALKTSLADFEASVAAEAAAAAGCDYIVTRDPKGFRGSQVPSVAPEEALQMLGNVG